MEDDAPGMGVVHMIRFAVALLILAGSAAMALEPAHARTVKHWYTAPAGEPVAAHGRTARHRFALPMGETAAAHRRALKYRFALPPDETVEAHRATKYRFMRVLPAMPWAAPQTPRYSTVPGVTVPGGAPWAAPQPQSLSPRFVQTPGRAPVVVPPLPPGPNTSSDRITHCLHAGAAAGLGANELGTFTNMCMN
jgi:hypothetical protein